MSTTLLGLPVNPAMVIPGVATLLGVFSLANGTYALLSPAGAAANYGLSDRSPVVASANHNPFIKVVGGRAISTGLTLLGLAYGGYHRAIGVFFLSGFATGAIDAIVLLQHVELPEEKSVPDGRRLQKAQSAAVGHVGIPAVLTAFGAWVLATV